MFMGMLIDILLVTNSISNKYKIGDFVEINIRIRLNS